MKRHARRIASMICALAMLTAMMPSAAWAETTAPETTVITEEASTPTATPAAADSTDTAQEPADNSGEVPVASPLPADQEQSATDAGDAQPAETPAASPDPTATPAPTATPVPTAEVPAEDDAEMTAGDDLSAGQAQPAATPLPDATEETADAPAADSNGLASNAPAQTLDETSVTVPEEFIINEAMSSAEINALLKEAAASENKVAQINTGTYESGFTVQDITLYVNGEVHVNGGITLKMAPSRV